MGMRKTGLAFGLAAVCAVWLVACGGGGGSAGSAASDSSSSSSVSTASGTVTGFGSVYVDGVALEDAKSYTRVENADGTYANVSLKLGERVRVAYDSSGTASTVTVDAAVIGAVSTLDSSALTLTVAGQAVSVNTDSTAGVVTVFGGGYTAFTDIAVSDLVEVHGSAVYSSTLGKYVVQATRIEKKSSISAVRVMGTLSSLDTSAQTFAINGLTVAYGAATLVPSTTTLANGQTVVVWGASGSLVTTSTGLSLTASRVRVQNAALADGSTSGTTQLGGVISSYSATSGSFQLAGVTVKVGSATLVPTTATLADGAYVQVTGTVGSDGSITATRIVVRQSSTSSDLATVRLSGAIEGLTDQNSFVVRGVPVDASGIDRTTSCVGVTLAVGTVVNVTATVQSGTDVVLATQLSCPASTSYTIRSLSGTAGSVDSTALSFVLTTSTGTQTVSWSDQTVFAGVTAATLSGASVVVQGYLNSASVLVARSIRNPSVSTGRSDADAYSGLESSSSRSWTVYRSRR